MKKRLLCLLASCGTMAFTHATFGAALANDNASNATYSGGGFAGLNGGTGFLAWSVTGSNGNGGFFGSYVAGTGQGSTSFGIYSGDVGSGAFVNAVRPFNGTLTAGQTFSVDLGNTTVGANGLIGLSLQNSANTTEINLQSDGTTWSLTTGSTTTALTADAVNTSYHFTLTYNGANSYSYTFTGATSGNNLTSTATLSDISQANFFDFQQGSGQNFGFNNLSVVPEPGTWATMLLGVGGVAAVVLRRRSVAS